MTEIEALNYGIFAMNTLMEPDASSDRDVEQLLEYAPAAVHTLVERRDALMAVSEREAELVEALRDLAGESCEAHLEIQDSCPTCVAVALLRKASA